MVCYLSIARKLQYITEQTAEVMKSDSEKLCLTTDSVSILTHTFRNHTMDLLRRVTSSNHDNMILLSEDEKIIEVLHGLQCRVLPTVDEISRKLEPRAVIFDRLHATAGMKTKS